MMKIERTTPFLAGLLLSLFAATALADGTTGWDTRTIGDYQTSTWRSDDFKGTASRDWDASGHSFTYSWNTEKGDQIGRIGVSYGSPYLGVKLSEVPENCVMSTDAVYTPVNHNWFYWSIYGWTNSSYTYWGNTPHGWNNEFYVIMYTDKPRELFLKDPGAVPKGSVTVDGQIYDCYATLRANQSQWLAVRRNKTWSASVNLKKISDYWRSQGLADEYVVDLGWALEGFQSSAAKLQLTNVNIPNLHAANAGAAPSAVPAPASQ